MLRRTPLKSGNKPLARKTELKQTPLARGESKLDRSSKIKPRSKKTAKVYEERRPLVARLLAERPACEACPVFAAHDGKVTYALGASCDVHELVRRSQGGSILDEANLMCVCRTCHTRIGDHPQLAFDLGLARHAWDE